MVRLNRNKQEIISYKMSRIRAKGSEIETIMGSALWSHGLRGYRKNQKGVLGTPDFCWKSEEKKKIKVRKDFWYKKIEDNIRRDKVITLRLRQDDWKVFRFWDFEIKKDVSACVNKIARVLLQQK